MKKLKLYRVRALNAEMKMGLINHGHVLGYRANYNKISDLTSMFLYFAIASKMFAGDQYKYFTEKLQYKELTPEEFLRLTPADVQEEKKRVFDLEPGDLVLVRDSLAGEWATTMYARLFRYPTSMSYECLIGINYEYIIKYTPELKKYIGSTDDIPGAFGPDDIFEGEV